MNTERRLVSQIRGFTVTELMIATVITAILAGLAAPSFQELIEVQRAKSAASDLLIVLTRARSEAIKRNAEVTLSAKSANWTNGWQIPDPVTGDLIEDHAAIRNLTLSGPASVVFQSSGRVKGGSSVNINISGNDTNSARCVTLDLSGRPSIKASSC